MPIGSSIDDFLEEGIK